MGGGGRQGGTFEFDPRRQPQIEVTFEIDSYGILNVGVEDEGTGMSEKITITKNRGRLTEEHIEKMFLEAVLFAHEDKKVKERGDAKIWFACLARSSGGVW